MTVTVRQTASSFRTPGTVIERNSCEALAPSIRAASKRAGSIL